MALPGVESNATCSVFVVLQEPKTLDLACEVFISLSTMFVSFGECMNHRRSCGCGSRPFKCPLRRRSLRCAVRYVCENVFFILSNKLDPERISVFTFYYTSMMKGISNRAKVT
jgi:hypothetical protein